MSAPDQKYIELIQSHLRNFKKASEKEYNFSCWYCGDSKKHSRKARAYLGRQDDGVYLYNCFNCGIGTTFKKFLRELDYGLYREYLLETLTPQEEYKISSTILQEQKPVDNAVLKLLPSIDTLDDRHHAKEYLRKRRIPKKWYSELYFAQDFRKFTNHLVPGKFKNKKPEPRLIIPFLNQKGELFGYQGRAMFKTNIRYITIMLNSSRHKVWNLNNVNINRRHYITEGPFDAMFLDNAMAVCGSDILTIVQNQNAVIIFDNEPRNEAIVAQYERAIDAGHNVVIWPSDLAEKDVNDMVLAGHNPVQIIEDNVYQGLRARMRFAEWKK